MLLSQIDHAARPYGRDAGNRRHIGAREGRIVALFAAAVLGALAAAPATAAPLVSAGESVARRNCAECHALQANVISPLPDAPTFPELRRRYDRDAMAQIVKERMLVIHPRMPKLQLDIDEVAEFLDYWDGLKSPARPGQAHHHHAND